MKRDTLKFNEDNKDKPYCTSSFFSCGKYGIRREICKNRDSCSKYKVIGYNSTGDELALEKFKNLKL